ncbi:MAG TPA: gamma-glutamyl-gamma-aminobutyrate hydrolase family protein [Roseiflexaceae bacterium]|nr:gamma-glutamyl-gamma-aminobutyrate hydrolase family protein [Roseiflexaceae bacterium]
MRPVIGIPCGVEPHEWYTPVHGIPVSYLRAIEAAGGIPHLIHLTPDEEVLELHYARCDALLLAGGDDVDPRSYGHQPRPWLGATTPLRDEVEIALARRAVEEHKPLLGICRGIQSLNVALGGTLHQDIAAELPDALDHREGWDLKRTDLLAHPILLERDSWLAATLGTTELLVNSLHHQALRDVAPALRITARAPDGVIEAVEGAGPGFVCAVQCHPEELWERADPRWARVFRAFVELARR